MESQAKFKIVLTDDDSDDQDFFREALLEIDFPCTLDCCDNGLELLDYLADEKNTLPDLVFLDLNMPILSGIETLQQIRSIEQFSKIPVIAIYSTSSSPSDKEKSLLSGANAYITKPSQFSELKTVLKKVFATSWKTAPRDMKSFVISA